MKDKYDQLIIEYSETDLQPSSVKLKCVLFILIFTIVPLAEIIIHLDYHFIDSYPTGFCAFDYSFEPLSFKEIK